MQWGSCEAIVARGLVFPVRSDQEGLHQAPPDSMALRWPSCGWMNRAHLVQFHNTLRACSPLSLDSPVVKWFVVFWEELIRDTYECGVAVGISHQ